MNCRLALLLLLATPACAKTHYAVVEEVADRPARDPHGLVIMYSTAAGGRGCPQEPYRVVGSFSPGSSGDPGVNVHDMETEAAEMGFDGVCNVQCSSIVAEASGCSGVAFIWDDRTRGAR